MTDQETLDADAKKIADQDAAIQAAVVVVAQEIAALKAVPAGTPLDFTKADAAIADLGTATGAVVGLEPPAPPAPAPTA